MAYRLIRALAAVVVATAALQVAIRRVPAEATEAPPAFSATAAADGVRLSMTVPNAPGTNTPIDGGGPSAQATVSSLGASSAFASLPYPGDLPVRLPGLLAGVGVAGVPQYPFYAASDHPTAPDAKLEAPGYLLQATSREDRSSAEAAGQGPEGSPVSYRSTADVAPAGDGAIVAAAGSLARNLRIGDLVIGEAVSQARVRLSGPGGVERSASFELTGVSIAGTQVSMGAGGVTVSGTQTPLPDDHGLLKGLEEQGIGVAYLAPLDTASGVVAGGVRITVSGTAPDGTRGTIALTLGRATAAIETGAGAAPTLPVGVDVDPAPGPGLPAASSDGIAGSGAESGGPAAAAAEGPALTSSAPGSRRITVQAPLAGPLGGTGLENAAGGEPVPGSLVDSQPVAAGPAAALTPPAAIGRLAEPFDAGGFYPMLVVAAALAYAVAQAVRILGGR
jgi:hypothetical protein